MGNPNDNILTYEKESVFTLETNNISNLSNLKETKIRFYTEPDTLWWNKNRKVPYKELNAYYIRSLSDHLIKQGFESIEYIETKDKGYKSSGERHPHSWSIVDKESLITWILE